MLGNIQKRGRV